MARYKEVFDLGQLAPEEKFRKRKVRALRIGNTTIVVSMPSLGSGNTNATVSAWGYQR
jgi:hypothetical protein